VTMLDPEEFVPKRTPRRRPSQAPGVESQGNRPPEAALVGLGGAAGNSAVGQVLGGGGFSAASLASKTPIPWTRETQRVTRPQEGASGGVYFMQSGNGTLVAKPEGMGEGVELSGPAERRQEANSLKARTGFATTFLSRVMKIATPQFRVVDKHDNRSEFDDLKIAIRSKLQLKEGQTKPNMGFGDVEHFSIQTMAGGGTLTTLGSKAGKKMMEEEDTGALLPFVKEMSDDTFLLRLGRLVVADAFMENADRLSAAKANIGNIMSSGKGGLEAIDQMAMIRFGIRAKVMLEVDMTAITNLFTSRDAIFGSYILGLRSAIAKGGADKSMLDFWLDPAEQARMKKVLETGITLGIQDLVKALNNSGLREELEAQAKMYPSAQMNWHGFLVRERYFKMLAQGSTPQDALSTAWNLAQTLASTEGAPVPQAQAGGQEQEQPAPTRRSGIGGLADRLLRRIRP
jgi:hypothetical protein